MSMPPPMTEICRWVLEIPAQLRQLRAALYRATTGCPHPADASFEDVPQQLVLVATEFASNALRHGIPPTIVRLGRAGDQYVVDVTDHDPASAPAYAWDRPIGEGGLGLHLARKLASDVGWYVKDGTKHVWARFQPA